MISSIVVSKWERGYVAYLRFTDPKLDENISAENRWVIHEKIARKLSEKGIKYASL